MPALEFLSKFYTLFWNFFLKMETLDPKSRDVPDWSDTEAPPLSGL